MGSGIVYTLEKGHYYKDDILSNSNKFRRGGLYWSIDILLQMHRHTYSSNLESIAHQMEEKRVSGERDSYETSQAINARHNCRRYRMEDRGERV